MATVAKRPQALADLERIWRDSAELYGVEHAEVLIERFDRMFRLLASFPSIDQARPDLGNGLRITPLRGFPFLIFFTSRIGKVEIIRILHAKTNYGSELGP